MDNLEQCLMSSFSPLKMFVCTYGARITGMDVGHSPIIEIVQPCGEVKTIICNFGHKTQEGFEIYLKKEKKVSDPAYGGPMPPHRRQREREGDGSCFNNVIEPVIIPDPCIDRAKVVKRRNLLEKAYYLKCFSTTGEIEVPGVILPTLEDWIDF